MMNELADRLKWGRHLCDMTPDEAEAIIKALRFAADMEKLKESVIYIEVTAKGLWDVVIADSEVKLVSFTEQDIYTAARKAVEELEKGD